MCVVRIGRQAGIVPTIQYNLRYDAMGLVETFLDLSSVLLPLHHHGQARQSICNNNQSFMRRLPTAPPGLSLKANVSH
jgi:hypothetical protein